MDVRLFFWINGHHTPFADLLFWGLTTAAQFYFLWAGLGIIALLADRGNGKRSMIGVLMTFVLAYVSVELILKPLIARPRPFAVLDGVRMLRWMGPISSYSFPSGHCASSAAAAFVLGSYYKRFRLPLALLVGSIAYSRIYLGVHYPSDCLAGLAVGVFCGLLAMRVCGLLASGEPCA